MTPTFLYLRGCPGSGKITVARVLERELGWRLFWIHDLDGICRIVKNHRIPRLMDEITAPIVRHLLAESHNVIYVRPSRDAETVNRVREIVGASNHRFVLVRLTAAYHDLWRRVTTRPRNDFRVHDKAGLDEYLDSRPETPIDGEHVIDTGNRSPQMVAGEIRRILEGRATDAELAEEARKWDDRELTPNDWEPVK